MKFDNCSELENDLQAAYTEQNTLSPVAENMPFDLPVKKKIATYGSRKVINEFTWSLH
jgi:hypothetical protein